MFRHDSGAWYGRAGRHKNRACSSRYFFCALAYGRDTQGTFDIASGAASRLRYHHIIDLRTGWPTDSGLLSVTLIGDSVMELDALATCICVPGEKNGLPLLERRGIEAGTEEDRTEGGDNFCYAYHHFLHKDHNSQMYLKQILPTWR